MRSLHYSIILILALTVASCQDSDELFQKDYPIVETLQPEVSETGVIMKGRLISTGTEVFEEIGFYIIDSLSHTKEILTSLDSELKSFSSDLRGGIPKGEWFKIQCFVKTEQYFSQGNIVEFQSQGYIPYPANINSFSPDHLWPSDTLVITGNNFGLFRDDITLTLGKETCKLLYFSMDTLTFTLPVISSGNYTGTLYIGSTPIIFGPVVINRAEILSFEPLMGANGTLVKIYGKGLLGAQEVMLGTEPRELFNNRDTVCWFYAYNELPMGSVNISITVNGDKIPAMEQFTFVEPDPFTVSGMNPTEGYVGDTIVITGTSLRLESFNPFVIFDDLLYAEVTFSDQERLECIVPVLSPGMKTVKVRCRNEIAEAGSFMILASQLDSTTISVSETDFPRID